MTYRGAKKTNLQPGGEAAERSMFVCEREREKTNEKGETFHVREERDLNNYQRKAQEVLLTQFNSFFHRNFKNLACSRVPPLNYSIIARLNIEGFYQSVMFGLLVQIASPAGNNIDFFFSLCPINLKFLAMIEDFPASFGTSWPITKRPLTVISLVFLHFQIHPVAAPAMETVSSAL